MVSGKIAERITKSDVTDWQFIRRLAPSSSVDLVSDNQLLLQRMKGLVEALITRHRNGGLAGYWNYAMAAHATHAR
jgi:hypothetical protein